MKNFLLSILFLLIMPALLAQTQPDWSMWSKMIGTWEGEGDGKTGQGGGTFSFLPDLGQHILVRKNHSEYPATPGKTRRK